MTTYTFKPTFLYIKKHRITGKLYFGKTTKNPEQYIGSGDYWKSHIKQHGKHIETVWYCIYYDAESIRTAALSFSKLWEVVQSDDWANLIEEDGIGNGLPPGYVPTAEHRENLSKANKGQIPWITGLKMPEEFGAKISKSKKAKNKKYTDQEKLNVSVGTKRAMNDPEIIAKCIAPHIKEWILTDPLGNEILVRNLSEYCRNNGLNKSNLVQVAKGRYRHSGGWKCRYPD